MISEVIRQQMAKSIQHVTPREHTAATGLTEAVYQQLEADFMPAPLVILHSPVPAVMAGVWSVLRETLLAGRTDRALKEIVAATVSKTNECPFCVEAHTTLLHAVSEHDVSGAILRGDYDSITDPQYKAAAQWVLANQTAGGFPPSPLAEADIPEMMGTVIAFHYLNRMANIFLGDAPLPVPTPLKGITRRLYAATAGQRVVRGLEHGHSLKFIPQATLPDDLPWAAANRSIAGAFAGFNQVIEELGTAAIPESVRVLVEQRIHAWNGEVMGMSRRWVEDAVMEIDQKHRAITRLALLTALASYQVDSSLIADFQSQYPDDAQLIGVTAWASWKAARRVNAWMSLAVTR
jgi:AhpD family alkylhydroperoxidase